MSEFKSQFISRSSHIEDGSYVHRSAVYKLPHDFRRHLQALGPHADMVPAAAAAASSMALARSANSSCFASSCRRMQHSLSVQSIGEFSSQPACAGSLS